MKRIIVCIPDFRQGGIPRCLQTLLAYIDTNRIHVDLICINHEGPYKKDMPNCNILKENALLRRLTTFTNKITFYNFWKFFPTIIIKVMRVVLLRLFHKDLITLAIKKYAIKISNDKEYDAGIAYTEGYASQVIQYAKCKKKLIWIHNNYAHEDARTGMSLTNFEVFDVICCVSNAAKKSFVDFLPQYAEKVHAVYNLINIPYIKLKAAETIDDDRFDMNTFSIISIGRICAVKHFDIIPKIMEEITHDVKWYIIGDGPTEERKYLEEQISLHHMEEKVILLGHKANPYNYLAKADLFGLTSFYESYPTVINEARVLNIPIVANDIPAVREMLSDAPYAIISNIDKMGANINKFISERGKGDKKHEHFDISEKYNDRSLQQFYDLIEC